MSAVLFLGSLGEELAQLCTAHGGFRFFIVRPEQREGGGEGGVRREEGEGREGEG